MLTSWGTFATDTEHAPACATTLIVSLGLRSTPGQVTIIVAIVFVLVGVNRAVRPLPGGVADWAESPS